MKLVSIRKIDSEKIDTDLDSPEFLNWVSKQLLSSEINLSNKVAQLFWRPVPAQKKAGIARPYF